MGSTVEVLNELTGNLGVLYIKLHQRHFYVKGHHFYGLHEKFETLYDDIHEQLDEVAERVLMLKGNPISTLGEFLAVSTIKEAPYTECGSHDMVRDTVEDFKVIVSILDKGLKADDLDVVTEDLFVGLKGNYEKHVWMLEAFVA